MSFCHHADQILPNLPAPHKRLTSPDLEALGRGLTDILSSHLNVWSEKNYEELQSG
jgi:hypothetical protein